MALIPRLLMLDAKERIICKRAISAMVRDQSNSRQVSFGQVEQELTNIASVSDERTLCRLLIGIVNISTTFRDDIDGWAYERRLQSIINNDRYSKIGPEELSRKWNIGLQTANDTLETMKNHGVRTAIHPMSRMLRVDHLHLHRPLLCGTWYADTSLSKFNSIRGNTCTNVFTQGRFTYVVPMTERYDAGQSLIDCTDDVGILERLVTDGTEEFTGKIKHFVKEACGMWIQLHTSEHGWKNQNHAAEREIGFLANQWCVTVSTCHTPLSQNSLLCR